MDGSAGAGFDQEATVTGAHDTQRRGEQTTDLKPGRDNPSRCTPHNDPADHPFMNDESRLINPLKMQPLEPDQASRTPEIKPGSIPSLLTEVLALHQQ